MWQPVQAQILKRQQEALLDEREWERRLAAFQRLCRERGVPCTVQRRAILQAVLQLDDHPRADQVYEAVAARLAGISRTTVYRTLETLVQMGVITKVCHPGHAVRYDRRTEIHHHLICLRCDRVIDISDERLDSIEVPDTSSLGFEVSDCRVQIRGICRHCREQEEA